MVSNDDIIACDCPHELKLVGQVVRFDMRRKGGAVTREAGEVVAVRFLGHTKRGLIPEYEVEIVGKTGRHALALVTRDHVIPI